MAKSLINKYIWLIDTIQLHGRITREELDKKWIASSVSDGQPMARRTFYNYRIGVEEMFNIRIVCDLSTFEYYIDSSGNDEDMRMRNWLLDSASMSGILNNSREISSRIMLEDVPSARGNLPTVLEALKEDRRVAFSYRAYNRVNSKKNVVIEPYFIRIFKQLWYVIGYNIADKMIKTYSLDRMSDLTIMPETFTMPPDLDPGSYFNDCFGIMSSKSTPKDVTLKVTSEQAKYFRALPLHHSQSEEIHDSYSLFHYKLLLTYDFTQEILSHGSKVIVVSPPELKAAVLSELKNSIANY